MDLLASDKGFKMLILYFTFPDKILEEYLIWQHLEIMSALPYMLNLLDSINKKKSFWCSTCMSCLFHYFPHFFSSKWSIKAKVSLMNFFFFFFLQHHSLGIKCMELKFRLVVKLV